ncbi:putative rRNA methylase-domain-containing protein [Pavlovales sp. CCMP2436]|nr:putative rRNA methylase-domain-containing protein [Pavlovales sp. CCMP2436]
MHTACLSFALLAFAPPERKYAARQLHAHARQLHTARAMMLGEEPRVAVRGLASELLARASTCALSSTAGVDDTSVGARLLASAVGAAAASLAREPPAQSSAPPSAESLAREPPGSQPASAPARTAAQPATPPASSRKPPPAKTSGGSGGVIASLLAADGCLTLARGVWAEVLRAGDTAIDATCGNGFDTADLAVLLALRCAEAQAGGSPDPPRQAPWPVQAPSPGPAPVLAQAGGLTVSPGRLVAIDVLPAACAATRERLLDVLRVAPAPPSVEVLCRDHREFPDCLLPDSVRLIVYNLGYLPGGDHTRTTTAEGTLASLRAAVRILAVGGALTVMSYPGHLEGRREAVAVSEHLAALDKRCFRVIVCRPSQNELEKYLTVVVRKR